MKKRTATTGLLSIFMLALSFSAYSAESEANLDSTSQIDADEVTESTSPAGEDIDKEITNARLRAESGSKSPVSMSLGIGYTGGSVEDPLDADRPNLSGNPEEQTETSFGGSIDGRLRLTENDSLTLGGGVEMVTPLDSTRREGNVENPVLGYNRAYKIGDFQTITSASATYATSKFLADTINSNFIGSASHNMMAQVGNSRFTAGASISFSQYFYKNGTVAGDGRPNYDLGFYPQLEYQINDMFTARTVFGYFNFRNKRDQGFTELSRTFEYQSVGLGTSISRNVYLYPNVQFVPDNLGLDKTNIALSATINLF